MSLTHEFYELLEFVKTIDNTAIANLHHVYRLLTGFDLGLNMDRERQWYEWVKFGHTVDDLHLAIEYLKREIKVGKRNPGALKLSNLIGRPDLFEEDLLLANKWIKLQARIPKIDHGRESVLKATHRPPSAKDSPPRSAADVLKGHEEFRKFCALKDEL